MHIRLADAAVDAAAVRAIYGPCVERTAISFELVVPSEAELARRIADKAPLHPWLVIEDAGSVLGYAYAGRFSGRAAYDWSVEASIYLDEAARGRGVGRALYTALFGLLAAQGYRRVMAGITLPNEPSVTLHERMGLTPVGVYRHVGWKFDRWHDVGWWQGPLGGSHGAAPSDPPTPTPPTPTPPTPPVAYTALPAERFEAALAAGAALLA